MKFNVSPQEAQLTPNPEQLAGGLVQAIASQLGVSGDTAAGRIREISEVIGVLQQPAATPEERALRREFGKMITQSNQEPEAPVAPIGGFDYGATGHYNPARFRGKGHGQ